MDVSHKSVIMQASLKAATVKADGSIGVANFKEGKTSQLFNGLGKQPDAWTQRADNYRTGW